MKIVSATVEEVTKPAWQVRVIKLVPIDETSSVSNTETEVSQVFDTPEDAQRLVDQIEAFRDQKEAE